MPDVIELALKDKYSQRLKRKYLTTILYELVNYTDCFKFD